MNYLLSLLSAFIISIPVLKINYILSNNHMRLNRYTRNLIALLISCGVFVCMCIGYFILWLFKSHTIYILGSVCLCFLGIYYLFQYKRKIEYKKGLDTSFYIEDNTKHKIYLENPYLFNFNTKTFIDCHSIMLLSYYYILNNFYILISCGLKNINIYITVIFTFLFLSLFSIINDFLKNFTFYKIFIDYEYLILGILLIILSIF